MIDTEKLVYLLNNLKGMLLTEKFDGNSLYGIDEWSSPIAIINQCLSMLGEAR